MTFADRDGPARTWSPIGDSTVTGPWASDTAVVVVLVVVDVGVLVVGLLVAAGADVVVVVCPPEPHEATTRPSTATVARRAKRRRNAFSGILARVWGLTTSMLGTILRPARRILHRSGAGIGEAPSRRRCRLWRRGPSPLTMNRLALARRAKP